MIEEYGVGDKVIAHPYRDALQIEVIGYIIKLGRGMFNGIEYIIIRGIKKNTFGDFFSLKVRVYKYDFDLVNLLTQKSDKARVKE